MSSNLLGGETSPYLLLHKDNPVHWRPWNQDALAAAEAENKPVLLSIGYTACHWCHVMNAESFADPATAEIMNSLFINVMVDREERPDIDQLYQAAANQLGHAGGWPLTMFLTPSGEPFHAGTYYSNTDRPSQPSFRRVIEEISKLWIENHESVTNSIARVSHGLANLWSRDMRAQVNADVVDQVAIHIGQRFDIFYGGITGAPKFLSAGLLDLCWRAFLRTGAPQFFQVASTTLDNICLAGIYDHLGGGFSRYAADERWMAPHFEKMLCDNALMVDVMTSLWRYHRHTLYRERIEETIDWALRDMKVEGAFASSLSADTEGQEGKYYVWSEAEIDAALMGTFVQRFKQVYNVKREGNWRGHNILNRIGVAYPQPEADEALLKRQRDLLLEARYRRPRPQRDEKILADSNGMMIAALAHAGVAMNRPDWLTAAIGAFDFVVDTLGEGDRLYHSWCAGQRHHIGFADDYAHMARAALMLWEATQDERFLRHAESWTRMLNEHFWDAQNGGYFFTSYDSDPLIFRARMVFDQAAWSGNGVMVSVLSKLHFITADQSYKERSNALIQAFSGELGRAYISMGSFVNGLENVMAALQIVIVGPEADPRTRDLLSAVWGRSLPTATIIRVESDKALPQNHPAHGKAMQNNKPTAYVCTRSTCSAPITEPVILSQVLQQPASPTQGQA